MLVDKVGRPGLARDAITGYSNIALVALPRISGSVTVCCVDECVLCSGGKSGDSTCKVQNIRTEI